MNKMPCLFVREFHGHNSFTLTNQVTPGCEWVLAGEGTASRKRDGTACLFKNGSLWKRYDAKKDRKTNLYKAAPTGAFPCCDPDPITGHWPHWAPLVDTDYWHVEALNRQRSELIEGATYELCGPKLQGNPEELKEHTLIRHGAEGLPGILVRTFEGIRAALVELPWEGFVFAHPDGRFAKIRRSDFGAAWPPETIDWSKHDNLSEMVCTCRCGTVFHSHSEIMMDGEVRILSRKQCPSCGGNRLTRASSDPEFMTIGG